MRHVGRFVAAALLAVLVSCGDDEATFPPGGSGGGGGGTGGVGGESGGGPVATPCGEPPAPTVTSCPSNCTGGCIDDLCLIRCDEEQECNAPVNCPPGIACQVTCSGVESCRFEIYCDESYPCTVSCTGTDACKGNDLYCAGASDCNLICGAASGACQGSKVHCADGRCDMQCFGEQIPQFDCGDSCECNVCMP